MPRRTAVAIPGLSAHVGRVDPTISRALPSPRSGAEREPDPPAGPAHARQFARDGRVVSRKDDAVRGGDVVEARVLVGEPLGVADLEANIEPRPPGQRPPRFDERLALTRDGIR